jgi:hypothetical protein
MEEFRPFVSGIIGALMAFLLSCALNKSFPDYYSGKSIENVKAEYGKQSRAIKFFSALGFSCGISLYFLDLIPRHDWRGFGLALGLTGTFPLLYLVYLVVVEKSLTGATDVLNAFARIQRTPRLLMYTMLFFFVLIGLVAISSFIAGA